MKALIKDNKVVDLSDSIFPVHISFQWMDAPENCKVGWILNNGVLEAPPVPEKTTAELIEGYKIGIAGHINSIAREKDYDNGIACITYANSTNATWEQEALAFIAWRDAVWAYAYPELDEFENGQREEIPVNEFLLELPAIVWPS